MRLFSSLLLIILLFTAPAFATAQFSELLEYNGKPERMFSVPLESYFSAGIPNLTCFVDRCALPAGAAMSASGKSWTAICILSRSISAVPRVRRSFRSTGSILSGRLGKGNLV